MLKLNGRTGWDSKLACKNVQPLKPHQQATQERIEEDGEHVVFDVIEDSFKCPNCDNKVPSYNAKFDKHELDSTIKCNKCKSNNKILRWTCRCGSYWHKCQKHPQRQQLSDRNIYNKCKPSNRAQKGGPKAKRQRMHMTHKELVAYDLNRQDREEARLSKRKSPPAQWVTLKSPVAVKICARGLHTYWLTNRWCIYMCVSSFSLHVCVCTLSDTERIPWSV